MSCSLSTFPSTRQVAPAAPASALRAAAKRQQSITAAGPTADARRPNYLLDVPVSAIDVDRWEKRWQEAVGATATTSSSSSSPSAAAGLPGRAGGYFQTASVAHAAHTARAAGDVADISATAAAGNVTGSGMESFAPFPPFVFAAVKTLPMTQLLKLRRQWLPHRQRFPLHLQRMAFLDAVLNHAVVALVGPAGSGRTLQVPIVLSETEVLKRRRLVVVSANATAARLTVLRLREERGEDVHKSRTVAAALPNFLEATESTSVVVTTAEVLMRQLLCDPSLEDVGCVVFDDAHLRSESTELCLSMLRDLLTVQQHYEQQQQQQQQMLASSTAASSASASGGDAAQGSSEATRRRRLHLVLNCPDEANATALLTHLASARYKTTTFTLQPSACLVTSSTTLYLEETVQWLLKCEKEGSCLVRDGGAEGTVEAALLPYAENVDAVARVMAASDANFTHSVSFRQYWFKLIQECVQQYDAADRHARSAAAAASASLLPAVLIVVPSSYYVHVVVRALQDADSAAATTAAENEEAPFPQRVYTALAEDAHFDHFVAAAQRTVVRDASQRWVIVATTELSQTVLPSSVDIGLVIDCARNTYTPVDATTMADTCVTEYSTIAQLRHRRRLAKMMAADGVDNSAAGASASAPVVIQLISKSVLHSAQHRRVSADPGQHVAFRLPFQQYVQLYQVLQAREEAVLAQRAAVAANLGLSPQTGKNNENNSSSPSVATKVSTLLSSLLIGMPASTTNKYEAVRRVMAAAESYLRASGHIAVDSSPGSFTNGRLALQPLGVLTLCMPVPLPVARLLVAGSLLRPSTAALTALGALWCCSDLLSLRGVGAVRAADASDASRESVEEQDALLHEARLFFARDSLSDVVSAFHVYAMWCTVRGKADAERDFLEECGVSLEVLTTVFQTQVGLCGVMRAYGLVACAAGSDGEGGAAGGKAAHVSSVERAESAVEKALRSAIAAFRGTAEDTTHLTDAVGAAMAGLSQDVSASRALHACVTAALYPSCVVPTGEDGTGLLYDAAFASAAGGEPGSANAAHGRRVVSFARDSLLSDDEQGVKAAGKPFLFLAKSIADDDSRDAAGAAATSTAATTAAVAVVEQLSPLHEAAALVFCGRSYERPRRAPLRCRGWSSLLTSSWRETRKARGLPPVAQLPPVSITVQSYDTVHCQQVVCTMDQSLMLTMRATTSQWLQQLRAHVNGHLAALVSGARTKDKSRGDTQHKQHVMAAEVAEAWAWWERRHAHGREWLREERVVVAHQLQLQEQQRQQEQESSSAAQEGEATAAGEQAAKPAESAARAAALRQRLFSYYEWQLRPGVPATVAVQTSADRRAAAKSAAAADKGDAAADAKGDGAAEDDADEEPAQADRGLPATYTGKLPPADVDNIFRQCARSVASKGTREAEARLLRDSPDMFSFLNPEDPYHEYYLFLLRQAAPDMEVLGDNLEELISFLEGVETELREELGIPDPNTAATNDGGDGILGSGTADGSGGNAAMWGGSGVLQGGDYEVHDIDDEDAYAGDGGGGLQLESAAINLKKNAGPTLAEQIEQSRRAQAAAKADTSGIINGNNNGNASTATAPLLAGNGTSVFAAPSMMMPMMGAGGGAGGSGPAVSTNAGETLADKLRAMQMAAMQGSGGSNSSNVAANGGAGNAPVAATSSGGNAASAVAPQEQGSGFLLPPPTAEDLMAAISGGEAGATGLAAPTTVPQQPYAYNNYSYNSAVPTIGGDAGVGANSGSVFQAPTTEELMALLGNALPASAAPMGDSVLGILGTGFSPAAMAPGPGFYNPMPVNPLLVPPPALPAKAIEERPPSVLIYPIPDCRKHGGNVRLLLAKSLGEALNMRVGPTVIVGRVARIDVPNRNVEARALALKSFPCAAQTVFLLRNDRIIDDPTRERREHRRREEERQREAEMQHEMRRRSRRLEEEEHRRSTTAAGVLAEGTAEGEGMDDPTKPEAYTDPSAYVGNEKGEHDGHVPPSTATTTHTTAAAAASGDASANPAVRIGVLSSSDEDEDDDSESSSSASSSSSD